MIVSETIVSERVLEGAIALFNYIHTQYAYISQE